MRYIELTRSDILNDLKKVYREQGKLTTRLYMKYGKYSLGKITNYDTFNNFKKEVLGKDSIHLNKISKEKLTKDVLCVSELFENMTRDDYLSKGKYSRKPIERHFGSWSNMLKELNLNVNCRINIPSEELLQDLLDLYYKFDTLSATIVKHHGKFSVEVYQRRFGSYNKAVKLAGLIPDETRGSDSPTATAMIKICSEVLGEKPLLEHTFDWLKNPKTNMPLYIDAYFPKSNIAFEYDGPQHFQPVERYGGEEGFQNRLYLDKLKNTLLSENNINLYRHPYHEPHNRESIIKGISSII